MTRNKDTVNSYGQMGEATEENGIMENNMEKGHMWPVLDKKNTENGKKAKESDGLDKEIDWLIVGCNIIKIQIEIEMFYEWSFKLFNLYILYI